MLHILTHSFSMKVYDFKQSSECVSNAYVPHWSTDVVRLQRLPHGLALIKMHSVWCD